MVEDMLHKSHIYIIHLTFYTSLHTQRKKRLFIFINLHLSLWTASSHFFESQLIDNTQTDTAGAIFVNTANWTTMQLEHWELDVLC